MQPSTMSRYARAVSSCHLLTRSRSVVHAAAILAATAWLLATAVDVPSFDSLQYAAAIRAGEGIVHPHHLLYHPAIWLVAQVARWLGAAHPELAAAAIHNALWGGVGAYLVARGLTETTGRLGLGLLGAACLVASSGFAVYATQNDAYVPALVCAVGAFVFAPRSTVISALFWALSTLFHQTGILL